MGSLRTLNSEKYYDDFRPPPEATEQERERIDARIDIQGYYRRYCFASSKRIAAICNYGLRQDHIVQITTSCEDALSLGYSFCIIIRGKKEWEVLEP